jgi:hypothetical protein
MAMGGALALLDRRYRMRLKQKFVPQRGPLGAASGLVES